MSGVCLNGATAYRDGALISDNPFDVDREPETWADWNRQFERAQEHSTGKSVWHH